MSDGNKSGNAMDNKPGKISGPSTKIANVEEKLKDLWSQAAGGAGADATMRATTLNIILYVDDTASVPTLVEQIAESHPCRVIVVSRSIASDADTAPDTLMVEPAVLCRPSIGGESAGIQLYCEELIITAGQNARDRVPAVIDSLLLPDLPVFMFAPGNISNSDPMFKTIDENINGLIVDSATFPDVAAALRSISALWDTPHFHGSLFDLDWQRIVPWRKALAQLFDGTSERPLIQSIRQIDVTHRGTRAEALLFLGWMIGRLHWKLGPSASIDNWTARSGTGDVALRVQQAAEGPAGLQKIVVKAGSETFTLSASDDATYLTAANGRAMSIRLPGSSTGALIGMILDATGHDSVFEEALSAAMTLSTEGHRLSQRAGVVVASNPDGLARLAAWHFVRAVRHAVDAKGQFTVALSGGSTPKAMYELLARTPYRNQVAWEKVHIFWGDERNVPLDSKECNQHMAREALLDHVPIPRDNIHGLDTGKLSADEVAEKYAQDIRTFFKIKVGELPAFDLILLGMGDDGHTASLFPHSPALNADGAKIFVANPVEKLNTTRLTLTEAAINNGEDIVFLVAGSGKADILNTVFKGPYLPDDYPSQRVKPTTGLLAIFADQDAAAKLTD